MLMLMLGIPYEVCVMVGGTIVIMRLKQYLEWTPLHVASKYETTGIVRYLVEIGGADVNAVDMVIYY